MNKTNILHVNYRPVFERLHEQALVAPSPYKPLQGHEGDDALPADVYEKLITQVGFELCQSARAMREYFLHENTVARIGRHILNKLDETNLDNPVKTTPRDEDVFVLIVQAAVSAFDRWHEHWTGTSFAISKGMKYVVDIHEALEVMKCVQGKVTLADADTDNKEAFRETVVNVNFLLGVAETFNSFKCNKMGNHCARRIDEHVKSDPWRRGIDDFNSARLYARGNFDDFAAVLVNKIKRHHCPEFASLELDIDYAHLLALALTTIAPVCAYLIEARDTPPDEKEEPTAT